MTPFDSLFYFLAIPACIGSVVALAWEAYHR
jgi:hypothetical protein